MQIIYISNRPTTLADTMNLLPEYMRFVDKALVIIPRALEDAFGQLDISIPTKFVLDEAFDEIDSHRSDHQLLNYYLRTSLSHHPDVEEEFIMSDDDSRPMKSINLEFYKKDNKYHAYYFYDLAHWTHGTNSFDVGQRNTYQVLKYLNYPHLSFASHMPQIINKQMLGDASKHFHRFSKTLALCEWSIYFNHARKHHPEMFHSERHYQTMCWPDCVTCWTKFVEPSDFVFENYSPDLYESGGPFHNLDSLLSQDLDMSFRKSISWHRYETSILRGERPDTNTILRSLIYRALRPIRRLKDVIWLEERSQLKALSDRIGAVENMMRHVESSKSKTNRAK